VSPNPAIHTNRLYTVLIRGVVRTLELELDDGEHIAVETATLAEVQAKIVSGDIDHALVVTAFGHLALRHGVMRA
jgi:hypothetical protein